MKHKIKAALKSAGETGVPVDELRTSVVAQVTDVDASVAEAAFNAKVRTSVNLDTFSASVL